MSQSVKQPSIFIDVFQSDANAQQNQNVWWHGACDSVDELLFVFQTLRPEAVRIRLEVTNVDQQTILEDTFNSKHFQALTLKALYLRGLRSIGFLAHVLQKQQTQKKRLLPMLRELDISFNSCTPCGESICKTLIPFLYNDVQLRILRLRYCERNFDVARNMGSQIDALLQHNSRLQVVDITGNRFPGSITAPLSNKTILSLGSQPFPHQSANVHDYDLGVGLKRSVLGLCQQRRLGLETMTLLSRFLLSNYSHHAYLLKANVIINAKGPILTSTLSRLQERLYPDVFHVPDEDDGQGYKSFLTRERQLEREKRLEQRQLLLEEKVKLLALQAEQRSIERSLFVKGRKKN